MNSGPLLLFLILISPTFAVGKIWAVLVSGCFGNTGADYAGQSSVYHAWHVLRDHGVAPERIILMAYDDIANNPGNPHPGKVFNDLKGLDVYAGLKIDYRRDDVNAANFMAILKGDAEKTGGKPVLNSTEEDNVFVYFLGHGDTGIITFLEDIMTVAELQKTLKRMHANGMYKKMVFYLESCLSGSMFASWAEELEQINVYAVTSSNSTADSSAIYCDAALSDDPSVICRECHDLAPNGCLGSDFGHSWMQNVDFLPELSEETMGKETEYIEIGTLHSPAQEFGDMTIRWENISEFMGYEISSQPPPNNDQPLFPRHYPAVSLNDAAEMVLKTRIIRGDKAAVEELQLLYMQRQYFDWQMEMLVDLVLEPNAPPALRHRVLTVNKGQISRMDCHHQVMHHFSRKCFNLARNRYAMTKSFILNNFCELGLSIERIVAAFDKHCANLEIPKISSGNEGCLYPCMPYFKKDRQKFYECAYACVESCYNKCPYDPAHPNEFVLCMTKCAID